MILDAHQKMHDVIPDRLVILIKDYCRYLKSK